MGAAAGGEAESALCNLISETKDLTGSGGKISESCPYITQSFAVQSGPMKAVSYQ